MIKANELRIGNYVNELTVGEIFIPTGKIIKITEIKFSGISEVNPIFEHPIERNYQQIDPIALTEEWLLKFGFEKDSRNESYWFFLNKIFIYVGINDLYYYDYDEGEINIQYVHQLQNLYFALTGNELTIN